MKNGGPAFPVADIAKTQATGISVRDYFAAQALVAFTAEYFKFNGPCFGVDHLYRNLPSHAYKMADAMLAEREKGGDA